MKTTFEVAMLLAGATDGVTNTSLVSIIPAS